MKEQYVGDINDYRKYALLRALAGEGTVTIGVCWMLTPSDSSNHGSKLDYLKKPAFREFDPPLFDLLTTVMDAPDQRRPNDSRHTVPRCFERRFPGDRR